MFNSERGKLGGMEYGSTWSSLFSTGCADPRNYVGPPVLRRCRTPAANSSNADVFSNTDSKVSSLQRKRRPALSRFEGMQVGVMDGSKSLLNFDENASYTEGMILLDSPRSVDAALDLGFTAVDFLKTSLHDVVEKMKANGEDVSDPNVCKERFNFLVKRRKQKLTAALQKRDELIVKAVKDAQSPSPGHQAPMSTECGSTLMDNEERRLQKIVETNTSRLRQQLLHRELLQRQREKEDQRLDQQRRNDEQRKRDQQLMVMEKSKKEEEAQRLRNEARELERREHQAMVELKRAIYEEKDMRVKQRIHDEQLRIEAANEAKHLRNMERRTQMKEQAEGVLLNRRARFQHRWELFEKSREEYEEQRRTQKAKRHAEAKKKEEKIEAAIDKCEAILQAKINKTFEKEEKAISKLRDFKEERDDLVEQKRRRDEMSEQHRKEIYVDSQLLQQEKIAALTHNIHEQEQHMKCVGEERAAQARLRHELMRQRELDKHDCVRRSKNIEIARRQTLEENIQQKNNRIEEMKNHQGKLAYKRRMHREEVERSRVHIPDRMPGPGDYLVTNGNVGEDAPKWNFGLPASVMTLRVLCRDRPAPGYDPSPGPCRYQAKIDYYSRHSRAPSPCFGKHDRWEDTSTAQITPGPADYSPPGPPIK